MTEERSPLGAGPATRWRGTFITWGTMTSLSLQVISASGYVNVGNQHFMKPGFCFCQQIIININVLFLFNI